MHSTKEFKAGSLIDAEVNASMKRAYEIKRKTEDSKFHRSIAALTIEPISVLQAISITPILMLSLIYGKPYLMTLWNYCIIFWIDWLELPFSHEFKSDDLANMDISRLLRMPSVIEPSPLTLAGNAALVVVILYCSFRIPDQRMPLRVLIRLLSVVHGASVAFFAVSPWRFPHSIGEQMAFDVSNGYGIMVASPIILGLGYYLLSETLARKIGYSLIALIYYVVLIPHKAVFDLIIVYHFSSIFMPLLYLCFGPLLYILLFIALYSLMVSNVPTQKLNF